MATWIRDKYGITPRPPKRRILIYCKKCAKMHVNHVDGDRLCPDCNREEFTIEWTKWNILLPLTFP